MGADHREIDLFKEKAYQLAISFQRQECVSYIESIGRPKNQNWFSKLHLKFIFWKSARRILSQQKSLKWNSYGTKYMKDLEKNILIKW